MMATDRLDSQLSIPTRHFCPLLFFFVLYLYSYSHSLLFSLEYLFFTKELIVFYAAGNAGQDSSTSTESTSKNSVSVGSSQSTLYTSDIGFVSYFSSKGPTYDKRIKPDLVAPGQAISSAKSNGAAGPSCLTTDKQGRV